MNRRAESVFESRGLEGKIEGMEKLQFVDALKARAADLWEIIDSIPVEPENREAGRLISLAKTELESSVMWAVKAVSRT